MDSSVLGGGGILDPDGAMEQLRAWKGRIDRMAADTQAMSNALQELRITAADDNGLAEVTIDSAGLLVDLKLGRNVQRTAPEVLSRTIMETIGKARAQLADRSKQIIFDTLGADSVAAQGIAERVGQRLAPDNDNAGGGGRSGPQSEYDDPGADDWRRRR
jgi:DNA-binding protein YbaB